MVIRYSSTTAGHLASLIRIASLPLYHYAGTYHTTLYHTYLECCLLAQACFIVVAYDTTAVRRSSTQPSLVVSYIRCTTIMLLVVGYLYTGCDLLWAENLVLSVQQRCSSACTSVHRFSSKRDKAALLCGKKPIFTFPFLRRIQ